MFIKAVKLRPLIILSTLLLCVFVFISPFPAIALGQGITIFIEGVELVVDNPPFIQDGRTLVPVRAIFEALGATVQWDGATGTVTATRNKDHIKLRVGSKQAEVNGRQIILDVPPIIKDGRTMVPLRFVSESLGARVNWDGSLRTITVNLPGEPSIRFFGLVQGEDGTPISGIPLEITAADYTGRTKSDSRGCYSLSVLSSQESNWWLSPYITDYVYYRYLVQGAKPGSAYELNFTLYPADNVVKGKVQDERGNPVAARPMLAFHNETGLGSRTITDANGNFSLPLSAAKGKKWQIELQPGRELFYQVKTIELQKEKDISLTFTLAAADSRLHGYLKDSVGRGLEGIYVKGESSQGYGISYTNAKGYFNIPIASSLSDTWKVTAYLPAGAKTKEVAVKEKGVYQVNL